MKKRPDNFFVFGSDFPGDGHDNFRQEIWERSQGPGPTMLIDPSSYHPRSVIPEYSRFDCPEVYSFEMAKKFVEWKASIKLNRWTLERGVEKENGSTSGSHRRIYNVSIQGAERWVREYLQPDKKIQVEHKRSFRAHLNRKGRGRGQSYRLEELYHRKFGPTHVTIRGKLIPTDDEQYRIKVFDLVRSAGSFDEKQISELEEIWRTIEKGYVVGAETSKDGLTSSESEQFKKFGKMKKREGMVKSVVRNERQRAVFRRDLLNYLRLQHKKRGKIWTPSCEICGASFGPDADETLAIFDCAHRNPLSTGERDTKLSDLMLLCLICHRYYTYHERVMLRIGKFDCETVKLIVLNRREIYG